MDEIKLEGGHSERPREQGSLSATDLFRALTGEQDSTETVVAESSHTPQWNNEGQAAGANKSVPHVQSGASASSFDFAAGVDGKGSGSLQNSAVRTQAFANPPSSEAQSPGSFTQIFASAASERTPAPVAPPSAQQFREPPHTQPLSQAGGEGNAAPALASSPTSAPTPSEPGEFTRIFVQLPPAKSGEAKPGDANAAVTPPSAEGNAPPLPPPAFEAKPKPAVPPGPVPLKNFSPPGQSSSAFGDGSFTQLFQSVPSPSARPGPAPAASPGPPSPPAFAQHPAAAPFSAASAPVAEPARSPNAFKAAKPSSPTIDEGGVTKLFSQLEDPPVAPGSPWPDARPEQPFMRSSSAPSAPPASSGPGFTELMQALSGPGETPRTQPAPWSPSAPSDNAGLATPMASFGREPAPEAVAHFTPPAANPPVNAGPGEFTRMISGAALPAVAVVEPKPSVPSVPAAKPIPAPESPPAPKAGALQQFLPILLILNAFLLLLLIVVVVFALRRH